MNQKNRVRLGVERLENRETPGAVNVVAPFVHVSVQWLRHHPWAIVHVTAPHVNLNVMGFHVNLNGFHW